MADDPAKPNLNLTPEEKRVFGQLFRQADTDNLGVVTGEVAVKFFEKTRLEPRVLGEIWQIADTENRGLLTPAGFGVVLRLIGHYQAGRDPTPELAFRPGPLPKFDGVTAGSTPVQPPPGPPPGALQPQSSGSGPIRVPPLTPDKVAQYSSLFEKSGAANGVLPGEQAKQIFERAGLPNEILGRIWNLADTEQRGALVMTEFVIAMHLLASFKSGALRALPAVLPAGLYEAATRRPISAQPSGSAVSPVRRQFSGPGPQALRTGSPLRATSFTPPPPGPANDWAITPADKARFDGIFAGLDKGNKGFITGEEAVPFFSESRLPEEALAQIWDLADINSAGRLTRDEFSVAMYLIRQQRGKKHDPLPTTLPPNLIPPSMRPQVRPHTASAFDEPTPAPAPAPAPAPTLPKSAADDLFGLDAISSPVLAPVQAPQSTGGSTSFSASRAVDSDPFGNQKSPLNPSSPVHHPAPQAPTLFKPFQPSSSFGQALSYSATGGSNASAPSQRAGLTQQSSAAEDLLGDADPEISKKLTNETAELANLSNQVGSLSKQMQEVQGQRAASQNELTQAASQKREFEARLAQLRSLYEQEVKDVKSLEERLRISRDETRKLQTEIAMIEGSYQDLQTQHGQTVSALQSDQQENANLKERMRIVNAEIAQLKQTLEKLKSEARQQKGLVAINKKQLATNEAERDKLRSEAEELQKSNEENARAIAAAAAQSQNPAPISSPALSTMSATNPFFRRQGSSSEAHGSPIGSPPIQQQADQSFDNIFGPSFTAAATGAETPSSVSTLRKDTDVRSQTSGASPLPNYGSPSSPTLSTNEGVPPPSESRQISSSFLPFRSDLDDSLSSSRQVSAPGSRVGDDAHSAAGDGQASTSTVGPTENGRATSPSLDRKSTASPAASEARTLGGGQESLPGAFSTDSFQPTPTGSSTLSEQAMGANHVDPFGSAKEPSRSANTKEDFDAAFAGFGSSKAQERPKTGNAEAPPPTNFNMEFPPISVVENDDESDSASEHAGFEDDFAPASPGHDKKPSISQPAGGSPSSPSASGIASQPGAFASVTPNPPTPGAQASPPSYDKTVSSTEQAHADVQQYSGLLPTREDPTSPPAPAKESVNAAPPPPAPSFGSTQAQSQPPPPAKEAFDEFGDEFDDLEDAKEGGDDDFADISGNDRSGLDDFNPVFDSPTGSKGGQHAAHGSDAFGDAFGDYSQSPQTTGNQQPGNSQPLNDPHDWDAIFAGLGNPAPAPANPPEQPPTSPKSTNGNLNVTTPERPPIGRALTDAGVHDDPILKSLMAMGYARPDAVAALEKYDYNLERAANYLASQS
ncbi:hypothetical protein F5884DRAFT_51782 [Xylogone sp. PMI_703]|nr:hypothetical protein F5884DRAFT_51782 [Xylogone sp. PMI_703]